MDSEKKRKSNGFMLVHFDDGAMLREQRVILGLSQQTVADRAGIPLQSYQLFESGKRRIRRASFQIACQVLEALEMDIPAFYHGDTTIGEEVFLKDGDLCYKKTGRPVSEDVVDSVPEEK